jgi:hypothetical protein
MGSGRRSRVRSTEASQQRGDVYMPPQRRTDGFPRDRVRRGGRPRTLLDPLDNHAELAAALRDTPVQLNGGKDLDPNGGKKTEAMEEEPENQTMEEEEKIPETIEEEEEKQQEGETSQHEAIEEEEEEKQQEEETSQDELIVFPPNAKKVLEEHEFEYGPDTRSGKKKQSMTLFDFITDLDSHELERSTAALKIAELLAITPQTDKNAETITTLRWAHDLVAFPARRSGVGHSTLSVEPFDSMQGRGVKVEGRPAFEGEAINLPGIRKGFARRHVIAWHTIKSAVTNIVNAIVKAKPADDDVTALSESLAEISKQAWWYEDEKTVKKTTKKKKKEKIEEEPVLEPTGLGRLAQALDRFLRVVNSSPRNLWAGPGYENSLINTYQGLIRQWHESQKEKPEEEIQDWRGRKYAELTSKINEAGGPYRNTLEPLTELIEPKEGGMSGKEFVALLPTLADNFEVDLPFGTDRDFGKTGTTVDPARKSLARIAGQMLDVAEKAPESTDPAELEKQLKELTAVFFQEPPQKL